MFLEIKTSASSPFHVFCIGVKIYCNYILDFLPSYERIGIIVCIAQGVCRDGFELISLSLFLSL